MPYKHRTFSCKLLETRIYNIRASKHALNVSSNIYSSLVQYSRLEYCIWTIFEPLSALVVSFFPRLSKPCVYLCNFSRYYPPNVVLQLSGTVMAPYRAAGYICVQSLCALCPLLRSVPCVGLCLHVDVGMVCCSDTV